MSFQGLQENETLITALECAASAWPDRTFLVDNAGTTAERVTTYRELAEISRILAGNLLRIGVRPGDRVALMAENQSEWIALFFAAARIRTPVVTINPRYRGRELSHMLHQSGATSLAIAAKTAEIDFLQFVQDSPEIFKNIERLIVLPDASGVPGDLSKIERAVPYSDLLTASSALAVDLVPKPEDPAAILYTSGTTGLPKGAVLTQGSLLASASAQVRHLGFVEDDVLVGHLPLNHVGGITCTVLSSLLSGASVLLVPAFKPNQVLKLLAERGVTVLLAVPTMYTLLFGLDSMSTAPLSGVRLCVVGGASVTSELYSRLAEHFPNRPIINLYGLSETSGACILSDLDDDLPTLSTTLGRMIGDFQAKIVDPNGALVESGQPGELQVKGACVASGYWDLYDETHQAFLENGWLATGDIAKVSEEGRITLLGRKKEMYIQGGYNVYPAEVESEISNYPGVAIVAGIGVPDPVLGEVGKFFVVPKPGAALDPGAIKTYLATRLADYKVPKYLQVAVELPLTASGKVDKAALLQAETPRPEGGN